jgi:hypothetical protein
MTTDASLEAAVEARRTGAREPTIAESIAGFNVEEAAARAAILLRLARDLGKPVPVEQLVAEVGEWSQTTAALGALLAQAHGSGAGFTIDRSAEGATYALRPV